MSRAVECGAWRLVVCVALLCLAQGCGGAGDAPSGDDAARAEPDDAAAVVVDAPVDAPDDAPDDSARDAVTPLACEAAQRLQAPVVRFGERIAVEAQLDRDCDNLLMPTRLYRVVVPAMQEVRVSTSDSFVARVQESCASSRCTAGNAPWLRTDTPAYTNATDADADVVVAVSPRWSWATTQPYTLTLTRAPVSPTVLCALAPEVHDGDAVWSFTASARNPALVNDRTPLTPPAHFYRVEVPAGRRVVVSPTTGTDAWVLPQCGLVAADGTRWFDPVERSTATAWRNADDAPHAVVVALTPHGTASFVETVGARFELSAPTPAAACATSPQILGDTSLRGLSTRDGAEALRACLLDTSSRYTPSLWWRVRVPAGHRVSATVTQRIEATTTGLGVAFLEGCDAAACLASGRVEAVTDDAPRTARAEWANTTSEPRDVVLAAAGDAPLFDLDVAFARMGPSGVCATALTLTPGEALTGQRFATSGPARAGCGHLDALPTLYYRVAVPADHELRVSVTAVGVAAHVEVIDACEATQCLATLYTGSASSLRWAHQDTGTREVRIAVSRVASTRAYDGTFDVLATLAPTPANAHCATPTELTSGVPVTVASEYAHDAASDCSGGRTSATFHRIMVPPGQRLRVSAVSGSLTVPVRLLDACDAPRCLDVSGPGVGAAVWTNLDASPRAVLVAIGSRRDVPAAVLTATVAPAPSDARCEGALRVALPASVRIEGFGDARTADPACGSTRPSSYRILRVPAHQRLVVRKTSYGSPTWLSLLGACGGACLSASLAGRDAMSWPNLSDEDRDVVLAVESESAGSTVDLSLSLDPVAPYGACATAPAIAPGESRALSWRDAVEPAPTCNGLVPVSLPTLFHAVDVPPGATVTASITSDGYDGSGVRILTGCAAPTCLSYWMVSPVMGLLTTTWRNAGDVARRVYVAASSTSPTGSSTLRVDVAP